MQTEHDSSEVCRPTALCLAHHGVTLPCRFDETLLATGMPLTPTAPAWLVLGPGFLPHAVSLMSAAAAALVSMLGESMNRWTCMLYGDAAFAAEAEGWIRLLPVANGPD